MANSYGDFTNITPFIVNESEFIAMVRSTNFILKNTNPHDDGAILNAASNQAYPRIGLILLAAKNLDNNLLFDYDQVIVEMSPEDSNSRYGAGIRRVAAVLTAALLIRNVPLNSDLVNVDIANNLETQAIEDLERIIFLYVNGEAANNSADAANNPQGPVSAFITYDVDDSTLQDAQFDVPDQPADPPLTYNKAVDLGEVALVRALQIPTGSIGFCWFYLTASESDSYKDAIVTSNQIKTHSAVSHSIQGVFQITNDNSLEDVILNLADAINSKTLNSGTGEVISNILVSPNRGQEQVNTVKFTKCFLYPDTPTNKLREGYAKLKYRNNYLNFDVRKSSTKATRDLLILNFYTVPDSYSSLIANDTTVAQITTLKNNASAGIAGMRFGIEDNFSALQKTGPVSILLNVSEAKVIPISIQKDLEQATNPELKDRNLVIDTFYFKVDNAPLSGNLRYRVSTTNYPATISFTGEIDLTGVTTPDEISMKLVDSLYNYTEATHKDDDAAPQKRINNDNNVLGIALGKHEDNNDVTTEPWSAVQIVVFKVRHLEYKGVIDILEVPAGMCLATGNYINRKTNWITASRSLCIPARNDYISTQQEGELTEADLLKEVSASASKVKATTSTRLQSVYDRIELLNRAERKYYW